MIRVASVYLPALSIERFVRTERLREQPELRRVSSPIAGSAATPFAAASGGGWRPGARWAQPGGNPSEITPACDEPQIARRPELREYPFKRRDRGKVGGPQAAAVPAAKRAAPLILAEQTGNRQLIAAACPAARAQGLQPGMTVTHARALIPDLDVRPADPAADLALLERLALHAVRHWSPTAAVSDADGLWLNLTGAAHLHGGEERFCLQVLSFCSRLRLTANIAVAGTPGAAHALARFSRGPATRIHNGDEAQALTGLPLACLRLRSEALTAAARFGLETVGDLMQLPRGPLARRLGMATVRRLDEALGRVAEPFKPVVPDEAPVATRHMLEPISTAPAIEQVIGDLLSDIVQELQARGLGVRALVLSAHRTDGSKQGVTIGTVRATRDPDHLARLFRLRIEQIDPGEGIELMQLVASHTERLDAIALGTSLDNNFAASDVATLVDQWVGRIGSQAVFTVGAVESDVPERACTRSAPLDLPTGWPRWKRPARLLRRPEPLTNVLALLPDHPPRRFAWRGSTYAVVAGDGPERIHGEWWHRDGEVWGCRDYFQVEDETGARFWLFRRGDGVDQATGDRSWYMHGFFG